MLMADISRDIPLLTLQLPWSWLNTRVQDIRRIQGVVTVPGVSPRLRPYMFFFFAILICDSRLFVHLDGVPMKSFLVIIFVYTTRMSLFLIREPLSVFASLPEEG